MSSIDTNCNPSLSCFFSFAKNIKQVLKSGERALHRISVSGVWCHPPSGGNPPKSCIYLKHVIITWKQNASNKIPVLIQHFVFHSWKAQWKHFQISIWSAIQKLSAPSLITTFAWVGPHKETPSHPFDPPEWLIQLLVNAQRQGGTVWSFRVRFSHR